MEQQTKMPVEAILLYNDYIHDARVDFTWNVARTKLLFDPRIQFKNELMGVLHLGRYGPDRICPGAIGDVAGVAAADIDHDGLAALQSFLAPHRGHSGIKAAHTDRPVERMGAIQWSVWLRRR